ncbi:GTP-binding protein EngB [Olavius algarvensis associated proteobacterium Delta 3]|nr:GTP-binding protein EngB [Olavius algarvensis associated proteobacterium Delta 3]CAB5146446.1 GTP-binding protein EngB [Olavius algarvensis associated proteobacterium Delta 3]
MIVKSATFITSAVKPSQYPPALLPEIAFAGRSNVGKSSLINSLVRRKRLVKTGSTPGRTQLLNFFDVNGEFTFVDLPGYGYAKVPEKIRKQWKPMVERYLTTRKCLRGIVLILDVRRLPGLEEKNLSAWLDIHGIPVVYAVTKADKLSKSRQQVRLRAVAEELSMERHRLILVSAKTRQGIHALWENIERVIA